MLFHLTLSWEAPPPDFNPFVSVRGGKGAAPWVKNDYNVSTTIIAAPPPWLHQPVWQVGHPCTCFLLAFLDLLIRVKLFESFHLNNNGLFSSTFDPDTDSNNHYSYNDGKCGTNLSRVVNYFSHSLIVSWDERKEIEKSWRGGEREVFCSTSLLS